MGRVTAEGLLDAIGGIDARYVEEAESWMRTAGHKGKGYILRMAAAAACLMLVVAGALLSLRNNMDGGGLAGGNEGMEGGSDGGMETGGAAGGADPSFGPGIAGIPEEIGSVTVEHYSCRGERTVVVEGKELDQLRAWADSLELGDAVFFAAGKTPGEKSEGGEVYFFQFDGGEFSYRDFGTCYLVVEDTWYPVQNPKAPPIPENESR